MSADTENNFGRRVRDLRSLRHISQKELARRVEVTPGFLSQVERGHSGTSVATALRIAIALGVTVNELYGNEPVATTLTRKAEHTNIAVMQGSERFLLTPPALPGAEIYWISLAPSTSSHHHSYSHGDSDEFVIGIEGTASCVVGNNTHQVGPGDVLHLRSSLPHIFHNDTQESVTVLTVATPSTQGGDVEFHPEP